MTTGRIISLLVLFGLLVLLAGPLLAVAGMVLIGGLAWAVAWWSRRALAGIPPVPERDGDGP